MRRSALLLLVLLSLALVALGVVLMLQERAEPTVATAPAGSTDAVLRVSVETLHGQLAAANPPLVWEFRSASSFAARHIPGSRVMSFGELPDAAANLDKRQAIVTLCA